jgi:hypothetical protein
MSVHAFVDESTHRGYLIAAAVVLPDDLAQARKTISGLILPRQRRIHFKKESDARRRQIIRAIVELGVEILVYDASDQPNARAGRRACLDRLVDDLAARSAHLLVLERDDSVVEADRRFLYEKVHAVGCADRLSYRHQRAHEECLLSIPDAAAWSWAKGGDWRSAIHPIVSKVHRL